MNSSLRISRIFLLLLSLLLCCCDATVHPFNDAVQKKEILIYCGTTMLQPIMELAKIVEQEKNCLVKISYGGSAHLTKSVEINKIGEVFFPGSVSYIQMLQDKKLISETKEVGYNEIALFVAKGNPKNVTADLKELLRSDLKVVIGADNAGSIGMATRLCLTERGIYAKVSQKVPYLTTDSKGLARALREGTADVVVNWRAVLFIKENDFYMDEIRLTKEQALKQKLVMGLLTDSRNPELGRYFIDLASSSRGQEVFSRYGF